MFEGLGTLGYSDHCVLLCMDKLPQLLFLLEAKACKQHVDEMWCELKYPNYFVVERRGLSGSLALLWDDSISLTIRSYSHYYIDATISYSNNYIK